MHELQSTAHRCFVEYRSRFPLNFGISYRSWQILIVSLLDLAQRLSCGEERTQLKTYWQTLIRKCVSREPRFVPSRIGRYPNCSPKLSESSLPLFSLPIDGRIGLRYHQRFFKFPPESGFERKMAVPKRKHSNARTGSRRAHDQIKPRHVHYCPKCGSAVPSHAICDNCGYYMGRTVIEVEE